MPLKTKPTTRLERRLLKQVAELKAANGVQAMKILGATRDKNEALTKLRGDLRIEAAVQLQDLEKSIRRDIHSSVESFVRRSIHDQRVSQYVAWVLLDASRKELERADVFEKNYRELGMTPPNNLEIMRAAGKRLVDMAREINNGPCSAGQVPVNPHQEP